MFEGLCQARPNALRDGAPPYLITPAPRSRLRLSPFTITVPVSPNLLASVGPRSGPGAAAGISHARPKEHLKTIGRGAGEPGVRCADQTHAAERVVPYDAYYLIIAPHAHRSMALRGARRAAPRGAADMCLSVSRSRSRGRSKGTPLVLWVGGLASRALVESSVPLGTVCCLGRATARDAPRMAHSRFS